MVDQKRGPPYAYKDFLPFTSESIHYNPGPQHMADKKSILEILPLIQKLLNLHKPCPVASLFTASCCPALLTSCIHTAMYKHFGIMRVALSIKEGVSLYC